jgi:hypothetical protein
MGRPDPSVYTGRMLRHPFLRLSRRAFILALLVLPLAGCGQTGRLFLRQPPVTFPPQTPPLVPRFHDLRLPACLYDAERAQLAELPPGAPTQMAPEAVTNLPLTAAVMDADGFQQDAPLPCALKRPVLLKGADLPKPTTAPAAATAEDDAP